MARCTNHVRAGNFQVGDWVLVDCPTDKVLHTSCVKILAFTTMTYHYSGTTALVAWVKRDTSKKAIRLSMLRRCDDPNTKTTWETCPWKPEI